MTSQCLSIPCQIEHRSQGINLRHTIFKQASPLNQSICSSHVHICNRNFGYGEYRVGFKVNLICQDCIKFCGICKITTNGYVMLATKYCSIFIVVFSCYTGSKKVDYLRCLKNSANFPSDEVWIVYINKFGVDTLAGIF